MKNNWKRIILLLITLTFLYLVFVNIDLKELLIKIQDFDKKYIVLLILSVIMSQICRGMCFQQLISKTVKAPLKILVPLCITGSALNIALPARAGDFFRAYFIGKKYSANVVKIFGSVILERIFDGLVILGILFFAIMMYNKNEFAQRLCISAAIVFIGCFIGALLAFKYNKTDAICEYINKKIQKLPEKIQQFLEPLVKLFNKIFNSFLAGFEIFQSPKKLFFVCISAAGIWFFECLCYYIMILGFNLDISSSVVLFIISFIALACMVPSTSIFIGPYQFAVIAAFSIYHVEKETALAISFIEQTIVTLATIIIAAIFLLCNNAEYKKFRETDYQIEEKQKEE